MIDRTKDFLYFPVAYYFRFFAKIRLKKWKPRIIVVTGSSGKTTLLNLIESQVGYRAKYTHHGNSAYGIPFNILNFERKTLMPSEWFFLFLLAPFKIFENLPKEKLYIVEADCDRPNEGKFLATLLKPEVTLWTNSTRTHSMNFDHLAKDKKIKDVEDAIAHEYGYFLQYSSRFVIVNSEDKNIKKELPRTKARIEQVSIKSLLNYKVSLAETEFEINEKSFKLKQLLPKANLYSLQMCLKLLEFLKIPFKSFEKFTLPPGRSSLFNGIKNTKIIDSTYNANLDSMSVILDMFEKIPASKKWAILGDMLEQGEEEKEEHEKLSEIISKMKLEKIILMGPRISRYTYPKLKNLLTNSTEIEKFENPKDVLEYLRINLKGGELLLFKGARFLEGVIENLLADKGDTRRLVRREKVWTIRRKKWGL